VHIFLATSDPQVFQESNQVTALQVSNCTKILCGVVWGTSRDIARLIGTSVQGFYCALAHVLVFIFARSCSFRYFIGHHRSVYARCAGTELYCWSMKTARISDFWPSFTDVNTMCLRSCRNGSIRARTDGVARDGSRYGSPNVHLKYGQHTPLHSSLEGVVL
jgi:hypothetical protein